MNSPERVLPWSDCNQLRLLADFARLRCRFPGGDADGGVTAAEYVAGDAGTAGPGTPDSGMAAIDILVAAFGLSAFERDVLLLAAGVEMDGRLAKLCVEPGGSLQRPAVTFGLALSVLESPHWSAVAPIAPLRRWRLVELDEGPTLTASRLRVDERILHFLSGVDYVDPRLAELVHPVDVPSSIARSQRALALMIAGTLEHAVSPLPLLQLKGGDPAEREDVAALAAAQLGCRLLSVSLNALPSAPADIAQAATLLEREALLSASALLIECGNATPAAPLRGFIERLCGVVFLGLEHALSWRRSSLSWAVEAASAADRREAWRTALGDAARGREGEIDAVVAQFRWSLRRIEDTARLLGRTSVAEGDLWRLCRDVTPSELTDLVQRIPSNSDWDDLILPEMQKNTLRQIVVHMRRRFQVHEHWGFAARCSRGLGITALFAGESGTGKTMAAEVLSRALDLELLRIDLSLVVSKYIGETEKNLKRVFDGAEDCGAILLFDEADALFGKRSEVKDSHDRYANIEVSYLLQRMESYRGLAILTTNQRTALDAAFLRRLRFVVQFPFPEAAEREAIWRRAFPPGVPRSDLAYARLARLQASGGHIQNIALAASFLAAEDGRPVDMAHIAHAAHADSAKRERVMAESETRGWT